YRNEGNLGFDIVGPLFKKTRPAVFRRRHFQDHVMVLCVRWYLRYCLTLADMEELASADWTWTIPRLAVRCSGTLLSFTSEFVATSAPKSLLEGRRNPSSRGGTLDLFI